MSSSHSPGMMAASHSCHEAKLERHVLLITFGQRRAIALEAAAYSIGRDANNAIVLDLENISRQHALLLRVPVPEINSYRYRLVDGNAAGKPSTNGTFVNGQRCDCHDLVNGDIITFGRKLTATYLTLSMGDVEFADYLESITYQSLKSGLINPKETLVGLEAADLVPETDNSGQGLAGASTNRAASTPTIHEMEPLEPSRGRLPWAIALALVLGLTIGGSLIWVLAAQQSPNSTPAPALTPGS